MSWADSIIGAIGGGGVVALARVAGKWVDGKRAKDHLEVEAAKVEAKREETGTHATERAYDRIERLLTEEREERHREREELRDEIGQLRKENAELQRLLVEANRVIAELRGEVDRLRDEMLAAYVGSEPPPPPTPIGRVKKG